MKMPAFNILQSNLVGRGCLDVIGTDTPSRPTADVVVGSVKGDVVNAELSGRSILSMVIHVASK